MNRTQTLTLFYDGQCRVCRREIAWLRLRNRRGILKLQNIHAKAFEPTLYGKTLDDFIAEMHAVLADGRLIKGVDVFYLAYRAVDLGWLVAPLRWPLLAAWFDRLYAWFARQRVDWRTRLNRPACLDGDCERPSNRYFNPVANLGRLAAIRQVKPLSSSSGRTGKRFHDGKE